MEADSTQDVERDKAEFWKGHIARWKESGRSQIDYCIENNLSRHRFTYWKCKENKKEVSSVRFIPVVARPFNKSIENKTEPIKVQVGGIFRIEVGEGFCSETLTRLIKTLSDIR